MPDQNVVIVIVGAGIAGLSAAIALASQGQSVTVLEEAEHSGGKVRSCRRDDIAIDVGPTVFTMPWVFEELLERAGTRLEDEVDLAPLDTLAHHRWPDNSRLDLYADMAKSVDAIGRFAGPVAARQYQEFSTLSGRMYDLLRDTFLRHPQPGLFGLIRNAGIARVHGLTGLHPFTTLWNALDDQFDDPRLRQLFARYSTYCGSSPYESPATLMLIAHVERLGVFTLHGGMRALAGALARVASSLGVRFRFGCRAETIIASRGRVDGIELTSGERLETRRIIVTADKNAVATGCLGSDVQHAVAPTPVKRRSLSAWTWAGQATIRDSALGVHNVLFSGDYSAEFQHLFVDRRLPDRPTIYVFLPEAESGPGPQPVFLLINAPADGDSATAARALPGPIAKDIEQRLTSNGIELRHGLGDLEATGPAEFARRYPATGGALYGEATHGWRAAFDRPGSRTSIRGLYLAGGSVHPGPGVPMVALSGRIAAASLLEDDCRVPRRRRV